MRIDEPGAQPESGSIPAAETGAGLGRHDAGC